MHHSTNAFSKSFAWSKEIFVENAVTETKWYNPKMTHAGTKAVNHEKYITTPPPHPGYRFVIFFCNDRYLYCRPVCYTEGGAKLSLYGGHYSYL